MHPVHVSNCEQSSAVLVHEGALILCGLSGGVGGQSFPFSHLLSNLLRLCPLQRTKAPWPGSPVSSTQPDTVVRLQPSPVV